MGQLVDLDPAIVRLVSAPAKASPRRLWNVLTREERRMAILAYLAEDPEADVRELLVRRIAGNRKFRPATVQKWDNAKLASEASRIELDDPLILVFLGAFHLAHRRLIVQSFFDKLGVRLGSTMNLEEDDLKALADSGSALERLAGAAAALLRSHPERDVFVWLLTARGMYPQLRPHLDSWLQSLELEVAGRDRGGEPPVAAAEERESPKPGVAEETRSAVPDEPDTFTTLDRVVVHALVDAAQQVEGSLNPEQVDDLVQEVVALNGRRHRSYFHLGLRDVLFQWDSGGEIPAENDTRRRWYWAGVIQGLARLNRLDDIVSCYDRERVVRSLGGDGRGPSSAAALHVVRALCHKNRHAEIAGFLQPESLLSIPELAELLHSEATRLLRADRAAEARPLVDLLDKFVEQVSETVDDRALPFLLEIRRRRAHCYRQLGEFPTARSILERLLAEDPDPEVKAMVTADLGLIDAGFRRLADLRIPDAKGDRVEFADVLERGRERFEEAARAGAKYSAHGRYCLGVLAAAREQWGPAVEHLEMALSVFAEEPDRYGEGKLLARARVYLGCAICQDLQSERLRFAGGQIIQGLDEGAELPQDWLNTVLGALDLASPDLAGAVAERILGARGPEALDALVEAGGAIRSKAVTKALLARVRDETRGENQRVRDGYAVLPGLLHHKLIEDAGEVLDLLEANACAGIQSEEFLDVVRNPSRYEPVWESEDASWSEVRCLESLGRYREAADVLARKFHQVLSSGKYGAAGEAEGILERIRAYGLESEYTAHLEARLRGVAGWEETREQHAAPVDSRRPVNVLFVGGDERQRQYDGQIERELSDRYPNIRVKFVHPGWSANWGPVLQECIGLLDWAHAVVIMQLIRTEFGRRLRKAIRVPWRGCPGHGKGAIMNSIIAAAAEVLHRSASEEARGS
ncbi:MAG: hypothetical protein KatS3mg081_2547 [Gemmatimonadales bacterium]|nr:MAG: hypothetical protein KatS3mg081_2547 [Gemmatimonadales bacterium]